MHLMGVQCLKQLEPLLLLGTTTSWEVGYKGLFGDKFAVGLDVYTFARTGSTQFTAIGPTFRLTGAEGIPADLGQSCFRFCI